MRVNLFKECFVTTSTDLGLVFQREIDMLFFQRSSVAIDAKGGSQEIGCLMLVRQFVVRLCCVMNIHMVDIPIMCAETGEN